MTESVSASRVDNTTRNKPERAPTEGAAEVSSAPGLPIGSTASGGSIQAQADRLSNQRFLPAQRSVLARSIGRVLGNQNMQKVMRATRTPSALIQRQKPAGADSTHLDALIAQVSAECDAFAAYKKSPLDGNSIPGETARRAGARFNDPVESWMAAYVAEKMGPLRMQLLNEMAAISGQGWPTVMDSLFGISYQKPDHKYTMELKAAHTLTEKAIAKIVPTVTISYTNAFGWSWHRDYKLVGVEINAGISVSKSKGKKVKPGGGLGGGLLSLDISGKASADRAPLRYCGGNDFTGTVTIVKTSAKAHLGPAGGALPGLTGVAFQGTPDGEVSFAFISALSGSVSGTKTDAGVDLSIGEAIGVSTGDGATVVDQPPELKEVTKLSKALRQWEAVLGPFNTGDATVSPAAAGYLNQMQKEVNDFKTQRLDPMAKDLQDQSVDPEKNFQLDFEIVGMASRSWKSATSNAARLKQNEDLSLKRAAAVETEINNRFANVHEVRKSGTGAHTMGQLPLGGGLPPMLDDKEAQELYEKKKKEAMEEKLPDIRKALLENVEEDYGPQSDKQLARRVYVFCLWEGFMIMKTLEPVVASSSP